jgi:hypothetical protein
MRFKDPDPSPNIGMTWLATDLALAVSVATGVAGALWVSDDYDALRFILLAFAGAPLAIGHVAIRWLYPEWLARRPRVYWTLVAAVGLSFLPANIGLLNALTSDGRTLKRTVEQGLRVVTKDVKRGGLGVLFKTRW